MALKLLHVHLLCFSLFGSKELPDSKSLNQPTVCDLSSARPVADLDDRKLVVCLA